MESRGSYLGIGVALGIAIGAALGVALDNIAIGMGAGIAIGIGGALAMDEGRKRKGDSGEGSSASDDRHPADDSGDGA